MKKLLAAAAMALVLVSCTPKQQSVAHTVVDVAGDVCQVIVTATDPRFAPLCTTAKDVADAISALVKAHAGLASDSVPYAPSSDEVYEYLANHGARYAKQ